MPTMTISGLASGLDTDEIIRQLMEIERIPVTRLERRKADLEVDRSAWKDIGSRLTNLLGTLTSLKLASTFKAKTAASSNEKVLTATATADAAAGTYRIQVQQLAQAHKVASERNENWTAGEGGTFTITLDNGQSVTVVVGAGDTLGSLSTKINNATTGDGKKIVSAAVIDNTLVITSLVSGSGGAMSFRDEAGSVLKDLGVIDDQNNIKRQLLGPQDAVFTVDNLTVTRSSNEINDVIPGVTLNLLDESAGEITLQITNNTQAAVDAVQKFVDQYNSAMDFIASKLGKTATGEPGDLFGDPTLARIQQQLRRLVFDKVNLADTKYTSAGSVGISTGAVSAGGLTFDRSGRLTLDAAKLTKALEEDPGAVERLFTSADPEGIAVRLEKYLEEVTRASASTRPDPSDGAISSKQKMLALTAADIDEQISRWEERLAMKEEQLRRQFTALEEMLGVLQNQAAWLAGQIASLEALSGAAARSRGTATR